MIKIKIVRALDILSEPQVNVQFKLQRGHEILHRTPSSQKTILTLSGLILI